MDPGPPTRDVRHAAGQTDVPADPQRIVALTADELDALCALGLQSRILGTTAPNPSYLGAVVHAVPGFGERTAPDLDAIRAAAPELILGSQTVTPNDFAALSEIAPTVFTAAGGPDWRDTLRTVGAATGRAAAADRLIDGFGADADKTGQQNDAIHFQASIVQFTEHTVRVFGAHNFAASVLHSVGVERPAAQQFTDKPYIDIDSTDLGPDTDFSAAEGDIVYVSFDSPAAKKRAALILDSTAWRKLSANKDNRVFVVNNEIWQTGQGIVAARGILADLRWLNAPIN